MWVSNFLFNLAVSQIVSIYRTASVRTFNLQYSNLHFFLTEVIEQVAGERKVLKGWNTDRRLQLILKLHTKKVATSVLFVSTFTICQLPRSTYHLPILLVLDADACWHQHGDCFKWSTVLCHFATHTGCWLPLNDWSLSTLRWEFYVQYWHCTVLQHANAVHMVSRLER